MQLDYYKLLADVCRSSYYQFVKNFWCTIVKDPLVDNWHIKFLCDEIQAMVERIEQGIPNPYDLLINIAPGTSKSTICSVMIMPWMWARMPHARMIGASYTDAIAIDLSNKSRMVVESPLYQAVFPDVVLSKSVNSKHNWANTRNGSRYAVATGGYVTGLHAHLLVADDPLNPTQARSKLELETANSWLKETLPSRKIDKLTAGTILVMQRLHQDDPSTLFLDRPNCRHICLPAVLTEKVRPLELRQKYTEDGLFDPKRMPHNVLDRMLAEMGQYGYSGQMLQDPIPLGGGMFKHDRIRIANYEPPPEAFKKIIRAWDKAATDKNYSDWTVGVKMGLHKDGSFWILDVVRGQWSTEEREAQILRTARLDGKKVRIAVEREPGSAGVDSAKATVKMLAGFVAIPFPATGKKELRADTYSVQVNAGNVYMVDGHYSDKYLEELSFFPNGKHDDQVDASSLAFQVLTNHQTRLGVL